MIRMTTTTRALGRMAIVKTVPLLGETPPADPTQNEATRSGAADASSMVFSASAYSGLANRA